MSIAIHAVRRGRLQPEERALIIGAGGIGAFATWAATRLGAVVTVCDLDEERLTIATALGAQRVVRPDPATGLAGQLREAGAPSELIYEVTGTAAGLLAAVELAAKGARIVLVGVQHQAIQLELGPVTLQEVELIGTNAHLCDADLPEAVRFLVARDAGWADVAPVALSLDRLVPDGLLPLAEGRSSRIKTLIDPWAATTRPYRAAPVP